MKGLTPKYFEPLLLLSCSFLSTSPCLCLSSNHFCGIWAAPTKRNKFENKVLNNSFWMCLSIKPGPFIQTMCWCYAAIARLSELHARPVCWLYLICFNWGSFVCKVVTSSSRWLASKLCLHLRSQSSLSQWTLSCQDAAGTLCLVVNARFNCTHSQPGKVESCFLCSFLMWSYLELIGQRN